ncbi:septum formation protein Maf [bacterium]|nr:septum formation protein Maf [bacterium]
MGIILASQSPRRRELLSTLGLEFTVAPGAAIDEARVLAEAAGELVEKLQHLAALKGEGIAREYPDDVVISADTVVEVDGDLLGKPADVIEAKAMLTRLSGRAHRVHTAVAVRHEAGGFFEAGVETTRVTFDLLDSETIARYIARAEPFDKAGAYAIQGLGALLVRRIEGDYSNVVGLPLGLTARLLTAAGVVVL